MYSDASGCVRTFSEIFRNVRRFSELYGHVHTTFGLLDLAGPEEKKGTKGRAVTQELLKVPSLLRTFAKSSYVRAFSREAKVLIK